MPTKAVLDSNVFLFGFERPRSNSHRILEMLSTGAVRGVVTDRIVREVMGYLRKHYGKDLAARFREFILVTCDLVVEADLSVPEDVIALVGRKDAGALTAARERGLSRIVSTDRDFQKAPERRTPREFLIEVRERTQSGEE
ncbi:MAG: type II toxin-antitoxin system VapC family toxin [Thermoplasmata archaeon]|nr:type II toxin-antitoxin system VapC family toxin [Thermoplasmata archaeon]